MDENNEQTSKEQLRERNAEKIIEYAIKIGQEVHQSDLAVETFKAVMEVMRPNLSV